MKNLLPLPSNSYLAAYQFTMKHNSIYMVVLILMLAETSIQQVNLAGSLTGDAEAVLSSHWLVGDISYSTDDAPSEVTCPGELS